MKNNNIYNDGWEVINATDLNSLELLKNIRNFHCYFYNDFEGNTENIPQDSTDKAALPNDPCTLRSTAIVPEN